MRNDWFTYIKIDEDKSKIKSSGIQFKEFIQGIVNKPKNILILSGDPTHCDVNLDLWLWYVKESDLESLYKEDVYEFGDFHWVDFESEDNLDNVDKLELAKLLYLNHKGDPVDTFKFKSLNNRYAYIAHDDYYIANVYMKDIKEYKGVIETKLLKNFKGRKKSISNVPSEILDYIYDLCKSGIIIDFERLNYNCVRIYTVGDIGNIDDAHEKLDRYRKGVRGIGLCYDTKKKEWNIFE